MKRLGVGLLAIFAAVAVAALAVVSKAQRADYLWNPAVTAPTFRSDPPRVVVDQAHHNASTAGVGSRYWPFARLLRDDGYEVRKGTAPFTAGSLEGVDVLVVANAAGAARPQFLGINLPVRTTGERSDPAFAPREIETVRAWVERGGSLLLIADHAPFGAAAAGLAAAFGVRMHRGFVEVPGEVSDPLLFSRDNGRLGEHPILAGDGAATAIRRVMTFTGQSLDGPPDATVLLRLPKTAVESVPTGEGGAFLAGPAGTAQGLALEVGTGRVVVLGEAAMLTAQVVSGERFGMNTAGNDNRQLALNILHWLSRTSPP